MINTDLGYFILFRRILVRRPECPDRGERYPDPTPRRSPLVTGIREVTGKRWLDEVSVGTYVEGGPSG